MSRRLEDNPNWGGARPGAGRPPKYGPPTDKEGKGLVFFKFSQWIYRLPIKRLTDNTGTVMKDGKEIPVVYVEYLKMWHEFGCTQNRILEASGSLAGGMLLDEKGSPMTKVAEDRLYN